MTERYVTLAEVRDLLEEVAESRKGTAGMLEDEDVLLASQKAALDHAQKVATISLEDANKLIEEVSKLEEVTDDIADKHDQDQQRIPAQEAVSYRHAEDVFRQRQQCMSQLGHEREGQS